MPLPSCVYCIVHLIIFKCIFVSMNLMSPPIRLKFHIFQLMKITADFSLHLCIAEVMHCLQDWLCSP